MLPEFLNPDSMQYAMGGLSYFPLTNVIPGEPTPPLDMSLFIVAGIVVALTGIGVLVATKGKLGYPAESSKSNNID